MSKTDKHLERQVWKIQWINDRNEQRAQLKKAGLGTPERLKAFDAETLADRKRLDI